MKKHKEYKLTMPKLTVWKKLLLYSLAAASGVLSIFQITGNCLPETAAYVLYTVAGIFLFASAFYMIRDILYFHHEILIPWLNGHPVMGRLLRDYRYRTVTFTNVSFFFNLVFSFLNLFFGLRQVSWWFITFFVYYLLLSIMRFVLLRAENRNNRSRECSVLQPEKEHQNEVGIYQNGGKIMIMLAVALMGSVVLIVKNGDGKSYPGYLILVVAAYTFFKIIIAVKNMIQIGKYKSPLLKTIRHIGYADAMMSLLSLQTAMFASFGKGENQAVIYSMNGLTGGIVCMIILIMGIHMILSAKRL